MPKHTHGWSPPVLEPERLEEFDTWVRELGDIRDIAQRVGYTREAFRKIALRQNRPSERLWKLVKELRQNGRLEPPHADIVQAALKAPQEPLAAPESSTVLGDTLTTVTQLATSLEAVERRLEHHLGLLQELEEKAGPLLKAGLGAAVEHMKIAQQEVSATREALRY